MDCYNKGLTYSGGWLCASPKAISYFMDPRNFLTSQNIFQFETLSYNPAIQTQAGVESILKNTYMSNSYITYIDTNGNTQTINKTYSQVIVEAASAANVSPYQLASRIRQEVVTSGGGQSATVSGNYPGYIGYYNYFNINATGGTVADVIINGLTYAQGTTTYGRPWTDPEKAIKGGALFLANEYISKGQDTIYLQKFNVASTSGSNFAHQYMQNIQAPSSEGPNVYDSYSSLGILNNNYNFVIPVYNNMPATACPLPSMSSTPGEIVFVTTSDTVNVRNNPGTTGTSIIATYSNKQVLMRLSKGTTLIDGYYWDKIVLPSGGTGYIATNYLTTNNIAGLNIETVYASTTTAVNVRSGPGTSYSIIGSALNNEKITRLEKGTTLVNGYYWDKVMLATGMQGYIASSYLTVATYVGDISLVPHNVSLVGTNLTDQIEIYETINGIRSVPTTLPKMTLFSTDWTISRDVTLTSLGNSLYSYSVDLSGLPQKDYYLQVELTNPSNTSVNKIAPITTSGQKFLGTVGPNFITYQKGPYNALYISIGKYNGDISLGLHDVSLAGNNLTSQIEIHETINGTTFFPTTPPKMTLFSADWTISRDVTLTNLGNSLYSYSVDLSGLPQKDYYLQVELTNPNNISVNRTACVTFVNQKLLGTVGSNSVTCQKGLYITIGK